MTTDEVRLLAVIASRCVAQAVDLDDDTAQIIRVLLDCKSGPVCYQCRAELVGPRAASYCSSSCRAKAWRERQANASGTMLS